MRDAAATRRRILAAATAEFSTHGIAGARVDRIAVAAQCNKAQLYAYFGNKEQLFDAVLVEHVAVNVDTVPIDAEDLAAYAVALYDGYLADPALARLAAFARLERTPVGDLFETDEAHQQKLAPIRSAQAGGRVVDTLSADDLFSMLVAVAATWAQASLTWTASEADPEADHARRRSALAETVRRAFMLTEAPEPTDRQPGGPTVCSSTCSPRPGRADRT